MSTNADVDSGFFGPFGNELHIESSEEFEGLIAAVPTLVPRRTAGRDSDHRERHCVVACLREMVSSNAVTFPFTIRKRQSPDFALFMPPGASVGIEHADFGTESMQSAYRQLERAPEGTRLEVVIDPQGELAAIVRSAGEPFVSPGLGGDEVERAWATSLEKAIQKKTELLRATHFRKFDRNGLLLYDNTGAPALNWDIGIRRFWERWTTRAFEMRQAPVFDGMWVVGTTGTRFVQLS
jgi:hypothetical protein